MAAPRFRQRRGLRALAVLHAAALVPTAAGLGAEPFSCEEPSLGSPPWSEEQMLWCCMQNNLGCPDGSASGAGDAAAGLAQASPGVVPATPLAVQPIAAATSAAAALQAAKAQTLGSAVQQAPTTTERMTTTALPVLPADEGQGAFPPGVQMVYDCFLDLDSWMQSWTSAKMSWCCQSWDTSNSWPINDTPEYCCSNLNLGCSTTTAAPTAAHTTAVFTFTIASTAAASTAAPAASTAAPAAIAVQAMPAVEAMAYDCSEGLIFWKKAWTASKMSYCCRDWQQTGRWPHSTPEYCCVMEQLGCWRISTSTRTTTLPIVTETQTATTTEDILVKYTYDCDAGLKKWDSDWSPIKRTWCCTYWASARNWHVIHPNNQYQEYCCLIEGRGCPSGLVSTTWTRTITSSTRTGTETETWTTSTRSETSTAPFAYNCHIGQWDPMEDWTVAKKEFCCLHQGLACPKIAYPSTSTTGTTTTGTTTTGTSTTGTTTTGTSSGTTTGTSTTGTTTTGTTTTLTTVTLTTTTAIATSTTVTGAPLIEFTSAETTMPAAKATAKPTAMPTAMAMAGAGAPLFESTSTAPLMEFTAAETATGTGTSTSSTTLPITATQTITATATSTVTTTTVTTTTVTTATVTTTVTATTVTTTVTTTPVTTTTVTTTFMTLPTDVFDCHAGETQWKLWWAMDKKTWCCANKGIGCEAAAQIPVAQVAAAPIQPMQYQTWYETPAPPAPIQPMQYQTPAPLQIMQKETPERQPLHVQSQRGGLQLAALHAAAPAVFAALAVLGAWRSHAARRRQRAGTLARDDPEANGDALLVE